VEPVRPPSRPTCSERCSRCSPTTPGCAPSARTSWRWSYPSGIGRHRSWRSPARRTRRKRRTPSPRWRTGFTGEPPDARGGTRTHSARWAALFKRADFASLPTRAGCGNRTAPSGRAGTITMCAVRRRSTRSGAQAAPRRGPLHAPADGLRIPARALPRGRARCLDGPVVPPDDQARRGVSRDRGSGGRSRRGGHAEPRGPRAFVRGLIHSDGSRYVAVVRRRERTYRYTRYSFANRSDDIKAIFCAHLDLLGIRWTRPNEKDIAIARKADVALLDAFIGPKR
jgi:hypothetical protein